MMKLDSDRNALLARDSGLVTQTPKPKEVNEPLWQRCFASLGVGWGEAVTTATNRQGAVTFLRQLFQYPT
jgi:hypothetical protein